MSDEIAPPVRPPDLPPSRCLLYADIFSTDEVEPSIAAPLVAAFSAARQMSAAAINVRPFCSSIRRRASSLLTPTIIRSRRRSSTHAVQKSQKAAISFRVQRYSSNDSPSCWTRESKSRLSRRTFRCRRRCCCMAATISCTDALSEPGMPNLTVRDQSSSRRASRAARCSANVRSGSPTRRLYPSNFDFQISKSRSDADALNLGAGVPPAGKRSPARDRSKPPPG